MTKPTLTYTPTGTDPRSIANLLNDLQEIIDFIGGDAGAIDILNDIVRFGDRGAISSTSSGSGSAEFFFNYDPVSNRHINTGQSAWRLAVGDSADWVVLYRSSATSGAPTWVVAQKFLSTGLASPTRVGSSGAIASSAAATQFYNNYNPNNDRLIDTSKPGWVLYLDSGAADQFYIARAPATAGSPVFSVLVQISATGLITGASVPQVRAYNNSGSDVNVPDSTLTAIPLNAERWDLGTSTEQHSVSVNTSRLTCQKSGLYVVTGHIVWASTGTTPLNSKRVAAILMNGATQIAAQETHVPRTTISDPNTPTLAQTVTTHYRLVQNDYVELCAYQNNGSAMTVKTQGTGFGNYSPEFEMTWVSA